MAKKTALQSGAEIVRCRRRRLLIRRGYISLLMRIFMIIAAMWVIFTQVFLITRCSGQGMYPAIEDGDLVLAYRLQSTYSKDDVVAYTVGETVHLGRIVARETDMVMMEDDGTLVVNGTRQDGGILYPTYAGEDVQNPLRVPEGMLYILGDYRTQTLDSRDFGPIPLENIQGTGITIVRRRGV